MLPTRRALVPRLLAVAALASLVPASPAAHAAPMAEYVVSTTVVSRDDSGSNTGKSAEADEGTLVCSRSTGLGVGGGCIDFGPYDSIAVSDIAAGSTVAFQVCLDNNGDGVCTSPDRDPFCPDQIFFSHGQEVPGTGFDNAIGPLPTDFPTMCQRGQYRGYIVFICNGVHTTREGGSAASAGVAHVHPAVAGTITGTVGGTGVSGGRSRGTFCGGSDFVPSAKRYTVLR